jgi:hypothetical protein
MPRRFPIFQFPNGPLIVAMVSGAVAVQLGPEAGRSARNLSNLAVLDWAYEEVVDGANWFRRLLGLGGVAYSVTQLVTRW